MSKNEQKVPWSVREKGFPLLIYNICNSNCIMRCLGAKRSMLRDSIEIQLINILLWINVQISSLVSYFEHNVQRWYMKWVYLRNSSLPSNLKNLTRVKITLTEYKKFTRNVILLLVWFIVHVVKTRVTRLYSQLFPSQAPFEEKGYYQLTVFGAPDFLCVRYVH